MQSTNTLSTHAPFGFLFDASCPCCFSPGDPFCSNVTSEAKVNLLRATLKSQNLSAYIITSSDAHNSEYVSPCDERRSYLTGFSGSAGEALVTASGAYLWTDSRYYLQVERQLGEGWTLMKQEPGVINVQDFLSQLNDGVELNAFVTVDNDDYVVREPKIYATLSFQTFISSQSAILLGRKTYDTLLSLPTLPFPSNLPIYVLTNNHTLPLPPPGIPIGRLAADMEDVVLEIEKLIGPGTQNVYVEGLNILQQIHDSNLLSTLRVMTLYNSHLRLPGSKLPSSLSSKLKTTKSTTTSEDQVFYDFRVAKPSTRVGVWSPGFGAGRAEQFKESWEKIEAVRTRLSQPYNPPLLIPMPNNLIDSIWVDRPPIPQEPLRVMPLELAGETVSSKIERVMKETKNAGCTATVINALDQIAWLFNLRGSDIVCNPVFFSYATLTSRSVTLFLGRSTGSSTISSSVKSHLEISNVIIKDYEEFNCLKGVIEEGEFVLVENESCSLGVVEAVENAGGKVVKSDGGYCVSLFKAKKNEKEIEGCRRACLVDAAAVIKFLAWLEVEGEGKKEAELADILETYRVACGGETYLGVSFDTISSINENSAVIHYKPEAGSENEKTLTISEDGFTVYLLDSGGQYDDGTTDVTRTVVFGEPSSEVKVAYTAVLQGHLNLARMKFPRGTCGLALDAMARAPLWAKGLDYGHGTGHGIGAGLNVHEGPFGISGSSKRGDLLRKNARGLFMVLEPINEGYFMSNEPGYYKDGAWGIRIESDMVSKVWKSDGGLGKTYLEFENLTWVPMCRRLIDAELLTSDEREWVNWFQNECRVKLEQLLGDDQRALEWLRRETEAV
ncbi:hypothetical protein TrLO_g14821 [Triparma laevis f. longispina]|uniref:Xaa-Pro aminopeptidase n=1 Tax=Triparma laevis f. longispina TaxID=1714387 RepID=A0A9W7AQT0_9STRA|nr:hypothetical protein TrLO_g14821 [Triparma laevis f. longispina]